MGCTVKIKGLSKSFRGKKLFSGLDLSVTAGESIVVLGRSGVGKSTLLSILAALTDFDTGSVKVGDIDLKKMNRAQRQSLMLKIGYLFQEVALFDDMTLWENVAFYYLYKLHMDRQQARSLAVDKLRYVDISTDVVDFYPSQISGGMKRKVGIARAIACDPEIIMLDEPTAGLDPISARMIDEVILKCSRDLGLTAITISHDLISAMHFSDRIAFLHEGKFILVDSSDSFNKSTNPVVRDFIDAGTAP